MRKRNYIRKLMDKIEVLKKREKAVILAHNYQTPEVQDVSDYVGDSLELAMKVIEIDADIIVFAGVSFMAEMAAILNPDKIVIHPDPSAGCPLADFITPRLIENIRRRYPNTPIVTYVNSETRAKAYSDYVVTSSSASKLISKLDCDRVIFGPDKNLAAYVAEISGKEVIPLPGNGHCPVHEYLIDIYHLEKTVNSYPNAKILVHPEASYEVRRRADFIGSTSQMLREVGREDADIFILGTEEGLAYRAGKLYPDRKSVPLNPQAVCIDMKKINLLNIRRSLEMLKPRVTIESSIAFKVRDVMQVSLELLK